MTPDLITTLFARLSESLGPAELIRSLFGATQVEVLPQ